MTDRYSAASRNKFIVPLLITGLFLVIMLLLNIFGLPWTFPLDPGKMYNIEGHSYGANVPRPYSFILKYLPDTEQALNRSHAVLFESEKKLGPAHVVHREIASLGGGRYSHWQDTIVFSASDNSCPVDNGQVYRLKVPAYPRWRFNLIVLGLLILAVGLWLKGETLWIRSSEAVSSLLAAPFKKIMGVVAVNAILIVLLLLGVEIACRVLVPKPSLYGRYAPGQYSKFAPYLMTTNEPGLDTKGVWLDTIHNVEIPYHIRTNNLGFRLNRDLDVTSKYRKKPGEKVVLIFGGSAVFGFGNTSNETTIAGYLESYLNSQQQTYKYTVFNMGNGGWVAFQEFLALVLYGLNLDPDWIVVMDGRNDIWSIFMVQGEDVGSPFTVSTFRNYIDGYLYHQQKPDFYRGPWKNRLIEYSFAYRLLTGKKYVPPSMPGFTSKGRTWRDVDRTISFYLQVQEAMLNTRQDCRYILSTQPMYIPKRRLMTDEELQATAAKYKNLAIPGNFMASPKFNDMLMYAQTTLIKKTRALAERYPQKCLYAAIDHIFPKEDELKNKYFVDDVHFNDQGNALIADVYTKKILKADLGLEK